MISEKLLAFLSYLQYDSAQIINSLPHRRVEMRADYFSVIRHSVVTAVTVFLLVFASLKTATFSHSQAALQETDSPGAVFTVTTTADSGAGTLRQAITDANAMAGTDTINFQIGSGFQTILLTSDLPTITSPVTIDGTSQPNYAGTPLIIISGRGLRITAGSSTVKAIAVIRASIGGGMTLETGGGNMVTGCFLGIDPSNEADTTATNGTNIAITNSANNQIGADLSSNLRNVIGHGSGINISGAGSTGNIIVGNYIGLRSNGTDLASGSQYGIWIQGAANNRVGGTTAAERNVIAGYINAQIFAAGIRLEGSAASGNTISGNYIGTDATGTLARANRDGIRLEGSPNTTIGAAAGTTYGGACTGGCNLISGNLRDGVRINGPTATGNRLDYNYIGLNAAGTAALRNADNAINLTDASQNVIGKPLSATRRTIQESKENVPDAIRCVQDNLTGDYIRFDDVTGDYTAFNCRSGLGTSGRGEFKTDVAGDLVLIGSGVYANAPVSGGGGATFTLPAPIGVRFVVSDSNVADSTCVCPTIGEQVIVGQTDLAGVAGSDANIISVNVFNSSSNGLLNLAPQQEDAIFISRGSNITVANNEFSLQWLAASTVSIQNGVGNLLSDFRMHFVREVPFDAISVPLVTDLNNDGQHNPNDPGDGDGGANNTQNYPANITLRPVGGGAFNLSGTLNSTSNTRFRITNFRQDHYRNAAGIEQVLTHSIGPSLDVTTDANGNADLSFGISAVYDLGDNLTVTATVIPTSANAPIVPEVSTIGDTSEFSFPAKIPHGIYDFDDDGKTDIAVVRPGAGNTDNYWYILNSNDNSIRVQQFGLGDDRIVAGDFQGDNVTDFAIWRPSSTTFYNSRLTGDPATNFNGVQWGLPTDIPLSGDFDDDGANDAAVFRPSDRVWYIRSSIDGSLIAQQWGLATDKLVPADYDGDGDTDVAVYRNGTWYISVCSVCPVRYEFFGVSSDIPVPADYDGDGRDDIAVWRPSTGIWYIQQSTAGFRAVQWGLSGDKVLNGDFDADSKNDIAVWRPSDGNWYILRSSDGGFSATHWGQNGDIPVPQFPNQ